MKKSLKIASLFTGFVFLFNPNILSLDILPDAVGYFFILYGLSSLRDLEPHLSEAYSGFNKALYIGIGRFVANVLFFVFDDTWHLIFSLVLGVLEIIFILPAFSSLSSGMGKLIESLPEKSGEKIIAFPYKLTVSFIIVRAACDTLSQLSVLVSEYGNVSQSQNPNNTLNIIDVALFAVIALVLGIIWLSGIKKYIKGILRNNECISCLEEKYHTEVLSNTVLLSSRRRQNFFACIVGATALFVCVEIDSVYIIPDFLFGILVFIAVRYYGERYFKDINTFKKLCIGFSISGALGYALHITYAAVLGGYNFPTERKEFFLIFIPCAVMYALEFVFLIFILKSLCKGLNTLIDSELSYGEIGTGEIGGSVIMKKTRDELKKRVKKFYVLYIFYACVSIVACASFPYLDMVWALRFLIGISLLVTTYATCEAVASEINGKLY